MSILIVDDDADVAATLHDILSAAGHRVSIADSPDHALALAATGRLDAIFTDLRMPGMSGIELRRRVAARWPELARRTVIVTGDTITGPIAIKAAEDGEDTLWLEKPFMRDDVAAVLERLRSLGAGEVSDSPDPQPAQPTS